MITTMIMPLSFLLLARKAIGNLVKEKESGMKDYLLINGCSPLAYHLAIIISELVFAIFVTNSY